MKEYWELCVVACWDSAILHILKSGLENFDFFCQTKREGHYSLACNSENATLSHPDDQGEKMSGWFNKDSPNIQMMFLNWKINFVSKMISYGCETRLWVYFLFGNVDGKGCCIPT